MKHILLIATGGTIASVRTQQGLKPVLTSEELLAHLPELNELCCPDTLALCSIDSTDLGPEHWLMMAKAVQENYALYDGFIICHGTDTLAYSAAAVSWWCLAAMSLQAPAPRRTRPSATTPLPR